VTWPSGELFRIKGHCQSNCTLFPGLRNVCGARSATLLFHAGHDRQRNINAGSTQRMLSAYNAKLRKYVLDNALSLCRCTPGDSQAVLSGI
jgi:hypothetical protein